MIPATTLFWVIVAALYAIIGAFWAGAAKVHGAIRCIAILSGEVKEEWPAARNYYHWIRPLGFFFLWPLFCWIADYRVEKERRAEDKRRAGS